MKKQEFVHLHNHTEYSLFDGLLRIRDNEGRPSGLLLELGGRKNAAMAITDHGNMYGAMEFYFAAREAGVKPIIGCEVYVQRTPVSDKSEGSHKGAGHLTLLAADPDGYANLCRLVSKSYLEGFNHGPKVDLDLLDKHSKGLICLSGCIAGFISRALSLGKTEEALAQAAKHAAIFGKGNFYLELMDNGMPEQAAAMKGLLEIAKKLKLPVVATNDCHYWKAEDWEAQDAKLCLSTKSFIADPQRFRFSGREYYFKSPEAMAKLFSHTPEALKNTLAIAERCDVKIQEGKPRLPGFGGDPDARLKALAVKGLAARVPKAGAEYKKRLEWELKTVKEAGIAPYFLIPADLVKHLRAQDAPVGPGRGPSAGSLLNYALGITGIDPIPAGLLFECFFNPERQVMPALEIDLGEEGRKLAVERLRKQLSPEAVAGVASFARFKARSLIWNVGAALAADKSDIAALQRLIPFDFGTSSGLARLQGVKELCAAPRMKKLLELTDQLCGLVTTSGFHSAGLMLAPGDAAGFVPLSNANPKREVTTQYDSRALVRLGFMKLDLLTLSALDVEKAAAGRIKTRAFDLEKVPLDDVKTWTLISHGLTTGVFQLESEGIKKLLVQSQPTQLEDLAALIALFRPGPMHNGMTETFVARKTRKSPVYPHPLLEPVLKETYGLFIYQKQAAAAAEALARFSPWEADGLRCTLAKKDQAAVDQARKKFIAGAKKNKLPAKEADKLFALLAVSAGYGYHKSQALSYALLAYRAAYLKANYPQEYMTALLQVEKSRGPEHASKYGEYLAEAGHIGVKI